MGSAGCPVSFVRYATVACAAVVRIGDITDGGTVVCPEPLELNHWLFSGGEMRVLVLLCLLSLVTEIIPLAIILIWLIFSACRAGLTGRRGKRGP